MSTRSARPSTVACGAGCELLHGGRARLRPTGWCAAPTAQPTQLSTCGALRVRPRRSSRATDAPRRTSARMRVTGGAGVRGDVGLARHGFYSLISMLRSLASFVHRAISSLDVVAELLGRHRHWLQRLAGEAARANSGSASALLISSLSFFTMAGGSRPGRRCRTTARRRSPCSPALRTSARRAAAGGAWFRSPRCGFTLPPLMCGNAAASPASSPASGRPADR